VFPLTILREGLWALITLGQDLHNPVIVSPDAGVVYKAKEFKEGLAYKFGWEDIGTAMIIKQRATAGSGSVDQMEC
jgi:ribose-phosphate pyrophosphokinase